MRKALFLGVIWMLWAGPARAPGQVVNGGFESGNLIGWGLNYEFMGSVTDTAWSLEGNQPSFLWQPTNGNYFAYLRSGLAINGNHLPTKMASELFSAEAGQAVEFDVFFDAGDALPNDDFGWAYITGYAGGPPLEIVFWSSVATVGDYGETGWKHILYPVPVGGQYYLVFGLEDAGANYSNFSALGVDKVMVTPEPATMLLLLGGALAWRRKFA